MIYVPDHRAFFLFFFFENFKQGLVSNESFILIFSEKHCWTAFIRYKTFRRFKLSTSFEIPTTAFQGFMWAPFKSFANYILHGISLHRDIHVYPIFSFPLTECEQSFNRTNDEYVLVILCVYLISYISTFVSLTLQRIWKIPPPFPKTILNLLTIRKKKKRKNTHTHFG